MSHLQEFYNECMKDPLFKNNHDAFCVGDDYIEFLNLAEIQSYDGSYSMTLDTPGDIVYINFQDIKEFKSVVLPWIISELQNIVHTKLNKIRKLTKSCDKFSTILMSAKKFTCEDLYLSKLHDLISDLFKIGLEASIKHDTEWYIELPILNPPVRIYTQAESYNVMIDSNHLVDAFSDKQSVIKHIKKLMFKNL